MSTYSIRQIKDFESFSVKKEEIRKALAAAFDKDDFTAVLTNHDKEFYGDFWVSTTIAGLLGGEVYLAEDQDRNLAGVAVWFPPGREMYDSEDQQQQALSILINRFTARDPALWEWWGTKVLNDYFRFGILILLISFLHFLPKYGEFTTSALGKGVKHNSWHLQTLGVAPEHQRKGVATALINALKEKVKEHGATLCLEAATDVNVTIYERLGFTSKGSTVMEGAGGEFTMWAMFQTVPKA